jgi:hypothetical protein
VQRGQREEVEADVEPEDRVSRRIGCQRAAAETPANRPITSGAPIITTRRSGSMTCW